MSKITQKQFEELEDKFYYGTDEELYNLCKEYAGIEVRVQKTYQFFDKDNNFIGDSVYCDMDDILDQAHISVEE